MRELVDSSGVVQAAYSYNSWGQPTKLSGSSDSDFQYAGYYLHARSGLNLCEYRAYSPVLGRFINRDSIGEGGGVNLYKYAGNEPIGNIDPSGKFTAVAGAGGLALAGGSSLAGGPVVIVIGGIALLLYGIGEVPGAVGRIIQNWRILMSQEHPYADGEPEFTPPQHIPPEIEKAFDKNWACHKWCLEKQLDGIPCGPHKGDRHSQGWLADCFEWCEEKFGY